MTDPEQIARGLSEAEKSRLIMGRLDWRDEDWQDNCGDPACDLCARLIDNNVGPFRLSVEDRAVRAILERQNDG